MTQAAETNPSTQEVNKKEVPAEIELTQLEALKLTAVSATAGKIIAESRFAQLQAQTIQRQLQENQSALMGVAEEERAIIAEIGQRLDLAGVINQYKMDPLTGKGTLQRPGPGRAPG
jgi:hypothetical protein